MSLNSSKRVLGVVSWGILSQIMIRMPNIDTLHSTTKPIWTLWAGEVAVKHNFRTMVSIRPAY